MQDRSKHSDRHAVDGDYRMMRRSALIGAVASLICAPAIVRATSLMPARGLPLRALNPLGEFYQRCFYHSLGRNVKVVE